LTAAAIVSPPEKPVSLSCLDNSLIPDSFRLSLYQNINFLRIISLLANSHLFSFF
jgi:hypothetical protein